MWAVLPAKDFVDAKQRLAPVLNPAQRNALFRAMLEDVVAMLVTVRGLDGILMVTRDRAAGALARLYGLRVLYEDKNRGQSAAVAAAARLLAEESAAGIITVPGDAPLATAEEIEQVIAAHGTAPAMTIVPSHDHRGSNCIAVSPPELIEFRFGHDSFDPHLAEARKAGVEAMVLALPGLALDIDTPDDLHILLQQRATTRTHALLAKSGIADTLRRNTAGLAS
jgi:2-phospho-L-lactate guanylyltransferase